MSVAGAILADREERILDAVALYEMTLADGTATVRGGINLAVLYWQATDFGFSSHHGLDVGFVARAAGRFPEILAHVQVGDGKAEADFWVRYIRWADLGEPLSGAECEAMIEREPTVLTPAFHAYAQSNGASCEALSMELLSECQAEESTRAKYIASVIEGVARRRRGFSAR